MLDWWGNDWYGLTYRFGIVMLCLTADLRSSFRACLSCLDPPIFCPSRDRVRFQNEFCPNGTPCLKWKPCVWREKFYPSIRFPHIDSVADDTQLLPDVQSCFFSPTWAHALLFCDPPLRPFSPFPPHPTAIAQPNPVTLSSCNAAKPGSGAPAPEL